MSFLAMRTLSIALAAAALALAGCGDILPKPSPPPALYRLTSADNFPTATGPSIALPIQLLIEVPAAEAALDTSRIALSRSPTSLDYFADAAWTDRLPLVLQARLLDSFVNAHRLIALAGDASVARGDAILMIDLRHFEADYRDNGLPRWHIELTANIVTTADRKVIATRTFSGDGTASQNGIIAIIGAADEAWRGVAKQIVDWTADTLANRPR